jgi:hypothetical protein
VKHAAGGTGEIHLVNGADVNLDPDTRLVLIREGSLWREAGLASVRATASRPGVVELATPAEAAAGTDIERAVTPAGLQGVVNGISRSTVRQTVLSAGLDASGYADFLSGIGTGSVVIDATPTPIDLSFADGFAAGMPVDYAARVSADGSVNANAGGVNYLYADYNSGSPIFDKTMYPPLYQWAVPTDGIEHGAILADFEGANGATSFSGAYGEAWTFGGSATVSTTAYKFGSSSIRIPNTTSYVQCSKPDLSDNWTVEFWFRVDSVAAGAQAILATDISYSIIVQVLTNGKIRWYLSSNGSSADIANQSDGSGTVASNTWHHYALVYDGANYKGYLDGVLDKTVASASSIYSGVTKLRLGALYSQTDGCAGYFDDFRFSPYARYLSGFSAPMAAFSAEDLHYFRVPEMRMFKGRPGAWTAARRLFLGEADTGADGTIDTVRSYTLRGHYESGWQSITLRTEQYYNHNFGLVPLMIDHRLKCMAADSGYQPGEVVNHNGCNVYLGTVDGGTTTWARRNTVGWISASGLSAVYRPGGGGATLSDASKWKVNVIVDRGW